MFVPPDHWPDDTTDDDRGQAAPDSSTQEEWLPQDESDVLASSTRKGMSLESRKQRDELIVGCVKRLRMTVPQILRFSKVWEFPFTDEANIWRRVRMLGLDKGKRRIKTVERQSAHDELTLRVFVKIVCDAARSGFPVREIAKEFSVGEGSRIRADMKWRIGGRLFYLETQRSNMMYQSWKAKLTKWVHYRKKPGVRPFRVLIVFEDESDLNSVLRYCKEVLEPHPGLTLFLLAYAPDLLAQYNTVTEDIFRSHRYEPLSLM